MIVPHPTLMMTLYIRKSICDSPRKNWNKCSIVNFVSKIVLLSCLSWNPLLVSLLLFECYHLFSLLVSEAYFEPVKYKRWSYFAKIINDSWSVTIFQTHSTTDIWLDSKNASEFLMVFDILQQYISKRIGLFKFNSSNTCRNSLLYVLYGIAVLKGFPKFTEKYR